MKFEEYCKRYRKLLAKHAPGATVTDDELIKLFASHVVIGEYEKEQYKPAYQKQQKPAKKIGEDKATPEMLRDAFMAVEDRNTRSAASESKGAGIPADHKKHI